MNQPCFDCGGKCCKTLIVMAPSLDGLVRQTRLVAEHGNIAWIDSTCKYLADGRCSIYNDRPQACKDYPVDGPACVATRENVL